MIYIVRHGQTEKNIQMVLHGRTDTPLNDTGRQQAYRAGDFFRQQGITFDRVYSSPLSRAVQTANIITGGLPEPVIDERLIEMDYGPYEGVPLKDPPQEVMDFLRDCVHTPAPEGMEQLSSLEERGGWFLKDLAAQIDKDAASGSDVCGHASHGDENILISTHAIAMKGLLECLTPGSEGSYWNRFIGNCSVFMTEYRDGVFSVPEEVFSLDDPKLFIV